jgi:putative tryptophan/tyrosine transport system substrate-binding protein
LTNGCSRGLMSAADGRRHGAAGSGAAFDPTRTLVVHCGSGFDARFEPYHSTHLSRYNAVPLSLGADMRRREFITLLGGAAAWPLAARAQQSALPVIGFLNGGSQAAFSHLAAVFRQGLGEAGYVEGQSVLIEYRWAEGRYDQLPALVADLVNRRVAVIASTGGPAVVEAAAAGTTTIPIVFLGSDVILKTGLVNSLSRPGHNVTGVAMSSSALLSKCLQFISELIPKDATVGVLLNPSAPETGENKEEMETAARQIGRQIFVVTADREAEIETVFSTLAERHAGGLVVQGDILFTNRRDQFAALATRHAIPAIYMWSEFTTVGGLIAYGNSLTEGYQQVGLYTGRILHGAKPGDLPVMQPTRYRLTINLKTARALGLTISPSLLILADEVIE